MSKRAFDKIMAGLTDAGEIIQDRADPSTYRVHAPAEVDVKAIRQREGLSQDGFAMKYGFTASTVRQWEQGRRRPEAAARILLTVIAKEPDAVHRALAS